MENINIYFVSDTHVGHDKDFLYAPRGFKSIEEHDRVFLENWNNIVKPDDIVYHLGDIMLGKDREKSIELISSLNGHIKWIRGNHDTDNKIKDVLEFCKNVEYIGYATVIKSGKYSFYLSHYPTMLGNNSIEERSKNYCLHGHTHSSDKFQFWQNRCYNVALDAQEMKPVNIEQIKEDIVLKKEMELKKINSQTPLLEK